MNYKSKKIDSFFNSLCKQGYDNYALLVKEFNIDYKAIIKYASWSDEKYQRICLKKNEDCELVLICWMPSQETKIHDHNGKLCQVYFLKGSFEESIYEYEDNSNSFVLNEIKEGTITSTGLKPWRHKLKNNSDELAMTLHLYSGEQSKKETNMVFDVDFSEVDNSNPLTADLDQFIQISKNLIKDEIEKPISKRIAVNKLKSTVDIALNEKGLPDSEFYDVLSNVVLSTPKTSSRLFFNQLFGGRQPKAIVGDLLAVMLNNSMYTYKVAGVQVGIEKEILNQVISKIGYGKDADGTFPAGGSMSNFMAILMARDKIDVGSKNVGLKEKIVAYTSIESHYSIEKNAAFIGLGRNNVRKIESDQYGKMRLDKLEEAIKQDIQEGKIPFFVNATAGTTVLGTFDRFEEIGKLCEEYSIWFHIDGAYAGGVLFSNKHQHLLKGVELSDSFSFNPHKMLGTPMTCSIILVNKKKYLYNSFSNNAEYLYQTDADEYNLGKTSFQCGRRNDALKFWSLWKSVGTNGLENIVDKQFFLADVARNYIRNHPDYTLYSFDDSVSVCFNYKNVGANELCTALYQENKLMVGYGSFKEVEFVRLVTINSNNNEEDILNLFKTIENHADQFLTDS